jgi:hypothetical protein
MPKPSKEYTEYKLITNLPPGVVAFVNDWILVIVATLLRKEVWSSQRPADEDENEQKSPDQAA